MSFRRMLPFILINILVSAGVVLLILNWWDGRQQAAAEPITILPTAPTVGAVPPGPTAQVIGQEPAAEETAAPEEEPLIYRVKGGDTLGTIADQFDVTIAEIIAANNLTNPDFLEIDQELVIPVGGEEAPAAPTATLDPSVPPPPIPTLTAPAGGEAVVEIGEIVGAGVLAEEAVSIVNSGSRPIALLGWRLTDEDGRAYTFGQVTLFGDGAAILVHTEAGLDGSSDLYWGFEEPIWRAGETATLIDAEGTTRSTYVVQE